MIRKKRKKTGELEVMLQIWSEKKKHKCAVCTRPLREFSVGYMAHVIPKGQYNKFRLRKKNIEVLCYPCHTMYDHETDKAFADSRFDWLFKKKEQLVRQYNRMSKANLFFLLDM